MVCFRVPADWQQVPAGNPKVTQFRRGSDAGPVMQFQRGDDSVGQEIERLLTGFAEPRSRLKPRIWHEQVAGRSVTMLDATGSPPAQAGSGRHRMLAAVFETRRGPVVASLDGSPAAVAQAAAGFWAVVHAATDPLKP